MSDSQAHTQTSAMTEPAPQYSDEDARLKVLADFNADQLSDDPELQAIVDFAARLCGVPASMVSLIEERRQFFLARTGLDERETPRGYAFCTHALGQQDMLEVTDATKDDRFADNPLVTGAPGVRYYAGQPLVSEEGAPLGTLCVIDVQPHATPLDEFQRQGMAVLAQAAMRRLQARRTRLVARREVARSEERFRALADSLPTIAFSADADGEIDYLNERWREFTGHDEFAQATADEVLHPEERAQFRQDWDHAVASGEPFEKENRLKRVDGQWRWVLTRALPVHLEEGDKVRWFGTITDIDESHKLSDARDMLAKELSHRIKNLFAVVTGLITLQARKDDANRAFADKVVGTLRALGRAHEFVRPADGDTRESLVGLLDVLFTPYHSLDGEPRVRLTGGDAAIAHNSATPLALVFHELATNSAKYGALSSEDGHVEVEIIDRGDKIGVTWTELGGPVSSEPTETGFGSRMVDMAVTGQLQGKWDRRFEPGGLVVELELPREAIAP